MTDEHFCIAKICINMKLKLIKDSEVVVSKAEYEELINRPSKDCEKECSEFHRAIIHGNAKYECEDMGGCYIVCIYGEHVIYPIKKFDSDDIEYNRICAEELVELLNQEQ